MCSFLEFISNIVLTATAVGLVLAIINLIKDE